MDSDFPRGAWPTVATTEKSGPETTGSTTPPPVTGSGPTVAATERSDFELCDSVTARGSWLNSAATSWSRGGSEPNDAATMTSATNNRDRDIRLCHLAWVGAK